MKDHQQPSEFPPLESSVVKRLLVLLPEDVPPYALSFAQRYVKADGNLDLPAHGGNRLLGDLRGERQQLLENLITKKTLNVDLWVNTPQYRPSPFHFLLALLALSPDTENLKIWLKNQKSWKRSWPVSLKYPIDSELV